MRAAMLVIGWFLGALSCGSVHAVELWGNFGGLTAHTSRGYNGLNPALIADVRWKSEGLLGNHGVSGGWYLNSVDRISAIGCYHNRPWATRRGEWGQVQVGAIACLVNGYPKVQGGGFFPIALPLVAWQPTPSMEIVPLVVRGAEKSDGWVFGLTFATRFQ
jgi:hypothetical protein